MTAAVHGPMRQDTRTILRVAGGIEIVGVICAIVVWANGGMTSHGPKGNLAWFALVVALGCIPTGSFFLLLGFAKWIGDRGRTD
jgi:hypothetical protein